MTPPPSRSVLATERAALAAAEAALLATVRDRLDDAAAAGPSSLPGWTRDMLVTHLARNADSNARMVVAALEGRPRPQYPGGEAERTAGIEAGRGRPAAELLADLAAAAAELAAALDRVEDAWQVAVPALAGPRPIWQRLLGRRFEVEVHHVDLDLGYRPADWPAGWVAPALDSVVRDLPGRARAPAPGRWGISVSAGRAWTVTVAGPLVAVAEGRHGELRGAAEGPDHAVLAWLLGRGDAAALGVTLSGADVAGLPSWFPYD